MTHDVSLDPYPEDLPSQTDFLDESPAPEEPNDMPGASDEPVAVSAETSTPIYGGEGFGDVRRRNLLVLIALPVYLRDQQHPERGIDPIITGQMLSSDIREAMAKAARKLNDHAMKYAVTGYEWSLEDIHYDMPQPRTLSATLVIERS